VGLAPWATSVALSWKPNVRYLQQRLELLTDVESLTGIRDYRFEDDDTIVARLDAPGWAEVVLQRDGLSLHRRLPEGGWDELLVVGRLVLGALGPQTPVEAVVYNQYLVEVPDMGYDEARRRCGERLGGAWTVDIGLTDWAFLLDGVDDGFAYQTEVGIVGRDEVPQRLTRFAGRMKAPKLDIRQFIREVHPEDVPQVAFFSDFVWRRRTVEEGRDLIDFCVQLRDKSTIIVSKLFKVATTVDSGEDASTVAS
jgi:hypothetical protein